MSEFIFTGLNAPAGFSINEHLKNYPANPELVKRVKKEILNHIKSFYPKGVKPNYSDWYAGVTDSSKNRYNAHRRTRNVAELPHYKKFYLFSMSNARKLEMILYKNYNMGKTFNKGGIYITSKYVYVFHEPSAKAQKLI